MSCEYSKPTLPSGRTLSYSNSSSEASVLKQLNTHLASEEATSGVPMTRASDIPASGVAASEVPPTQTNAHSVSGIAASVVPLPFYSDRVVSSIRNNSIIAELDRMVEETAYHLLKHGDILNRADYDTYGRRLHDAYPCIAFPGSEPWVRLSFMFCSRWYSLQCVVQLFMDIFISYLPFNGNNGTS